MTTVSLPPSAEDQVYVQISALEGGLLTLPEKLFVTDADPDKRATVPSLSFLIQHPEKDEKATRFVFDLGLKRDLSQYRPAMKTHISNRQPVSANPDVADSLRAGGFDPAKDIDIVMLSHVHWDHVGTPTDFPNSQFVVGSGTLHLLKHGAGSHYPAEIFDPDLLPRDRTKELPPTSASDPATAAPSQQQTKHQWQPLAGFPAVADFFEDGSLYVVDSPGHLYGHVNLLARVGKDKWVYLGGDCCHDFRILTGEKGIAMYDDGHGGLRSVHTNTDIAAQTLKRIQPLVGHSQIEVVVAHDVGWKAKNKARFLPGKL